MNFVFHFFARQIVKAWTLIFSFLLDRLLQYEKLDDSSDDSDATASSDSENDGHSAGKK